MNNHKAKGIAAMTVSQFLRYCMETGMVDEILAKSYTPEDVATVKAEITEIADQQAQSAEYHGKLWQVTE